MKQPASPGSPEQWTRDEPTPERRRLLKAAAAAAPLIATLPSGAARAMSSTSQCIILDRQACQQDPTFQGAVHPIDYDGFDRGYGQEYVYTNGPNDITVYFIPDVSADNLYFGSSGTLENGTTYTIGEVFHASGDNATGEYDWSQKSGPQDVLLLRLYRAESDTGDVENNPTGLTTCDLGSNDPGVCVFPVSQIGPPDSSQDATGNNTGLTTSCLTSFDPNGPDIPTMM